MSNQLSRLVGAHGDQKLPQIAAVAKLREFALFGPKTETFEYTLRHVLPIRAVESDNA
jgi:hypothetical protein